MQTPYPCVANDCGPGTRQSSAAELTAIRLTSELAAGHGLRPRHYLSVTVSAWILQDFAPRPMNPILRQHYLNPVILDIHDPNAVDQD